jgi:hypothetical protein
MPFEPNAIQWRQDPFGRVKDLIQSSQSGHGFTLGKQSNPGKERVIVVESQELGATHVPLRTVMEHTEMIVNGSSIRNKIWIQAVSKKGLRTEQLMRKSRMDENILDNGSNFAVICQGLPVSNSNVFNLKTARDTTKFNRILQLPEGGR